MFPQVSQPVDYYIKNPKFISGVVDPAIKTANKILPEKLQIPTPPAIMGVATDADAANSPIKELTTQITRQAASLAGEQINYLKDAAGEAFCSALIEKIQSECGQ